MKDKNPESHNNLHLFIGLWSTGEDPETRCRYHTLYWNCVIIGRSCDGL